jgi:HlyD family secretion protein
VERPQPPVFDPATNPYAHGIYAQGIIESDQPSGENINIYPEVPGTVRRILVEEGQHVQRGAPLLEIDDSVQRAAAEQQHAQWQAALTLLAELRAQPREENLNVARAQLEAARASLKTAEDALAKQQNAWELNPHAISRDALDGAANAAAVARANLAVAQRQYDLIHAGAWSYDIANQEKQADALGKAWASSNALLAKYTIRSPGDAVVMAISAVTGGFVSTQGAWDAYRQGNAPVIVLGTTHVSLNVRCYVDEILVGRLPAPERIRAQMSVRGSTVKLPLAFVRVQPLVSPKIELSDQRAERVDVRVLPVIFRVDKPRDLILYPGQLVDIYIGGQS